MESSVLSSRNAAICEVLSTSVNRFYNTRIHTHCVQYLAHLLLPTRTQLLDPAAIASPSVKGTKMILVQPCRF
jgi:hypothetical protein